MSDFRSYANVQGKRINRYHSYIESITVLSDADASTPP